MLGEYDAGYENYIDSLIREMEKLQDENDNYIDSLIREMEKLQDENDKLSEQVSSLGEQVSSLVGRSFRTADKMSCIEAENAKLRELIRELFRDFANADYELKSRCGRTFMAVTRYLPRLQELEVEP